MIDTTQLLNLSQMGKEHHGDDDIDIRADEDEDSLSDFSDSSSSSSIDGPLNHLSDPMAQLPVKRGLSKYYSGKSRSFAAVGSVKGLEEVAKKENPYNVRMKMRRRSHGDGLDGHFRHQQRRRVRFCTPKPVIAKKGGCSWRNSDISVHIHK